VEAQASRTEKNPNCNSNHTANYRGCNKWKESRAANSKEVHAAKTKTEGT
jgi:hypothetical protein